MNLENGVKLFENIFDKKTFDYLDKESCSILDDPSTLWRVNKSNWTATNPYISNYGQAGTIISCFVSETAKELMVAAVEDKMEFSIDFEQTQFSYTYMFRGAFIPWHNDSHCDIASTFYFQDWCHDHGGLYLFSNQTEQEEFDKDCGKITGLNPKKNTLLLQHKIMHAVTPLTPATPVRRSIQSFMHFAK